MSSNQGTEDDVFDEEQEELRREWEEDSVQEDEEEVDSVKEVEEDEDEKEDEKETELEQVFEEKEEEDRELQQQQEEEQEQARERVNEAIIAQGPEQGEEQQVMERTTRQGPSPSLGTLWLLAALAFYVFVAGCIGASVGLENAALAIILPLLSVAITVGKIVAELQERKIPPECDILLGVLLVVLWTISVFVFTFQAPFLTPGTGFFSTWLCLVFSVYYVSIECNGLQKSVELSLDCSGVELKAQS